MITDLHWRLGDGEYIAEYLPMFAAFQIDKAAASLAIPNLDAVIDSITNAREGHWQEALMMAMKERNAYARFADEPERGVDASWLPPPAAQMFSLIRQAPELIFLMVQPPRPMKVVVVDDQKIVLMMMAFILDRWPGLTVQYVHQQAGAPVIIDDDATIVLLDEHMEGRSGSAVHAYYSAHGHRAVFASISTTGNKPRFAARQYDEKTTLPNNRGSAEKFIRFINELIGDALMANP